MDEMQLYECTIRSQRDRVNPEPMPEGTDGLDEGDQTPSRVPGIQGSEWPGSWLVLLLFVQQAPKVAQGAHPPLGG